MKPRATSTKPDRADLDGACAVVGTEDPQITQMRAEPG